MPRQINNIGLYVIHAQYYYSLHSVETWLWLKLMVKITQEHQQLLTLITDHDAGHLQRKSLYISRYISKSVFDAQK